MPRPFVALVSTLGVIGGAGLGGCGDHGKSKAPASREPSSDFTPGTVTLTVPTTTAPSGDFAPGTATLTIRRTTPAP